MKKFTDYLAMAKKEYSFKLKFAVEITDETVDRIEELLRKYDVQSVSNIAKTIMQKHPLDFANIPAGEIYIVNIVLDYPVTEADLQAYLSNNLGIPESHLVVRNLDHPDDREPEEESGEYQSVLDSDYPVDEKPNLNDGEYVKGFLNHLESMRKEQKKGEKEFEKEPEHEMDHEYINSDEHALSPISGTNEMPGWPKRGKDK